jgi:hypothetical protein
MEGLKNPAFIMTKDPEHPSVTIPNMLFLGAAVRLRSVC